MLIMELDYPLGELIGYPKEEGIGYKCFGYCYKEHYIEDGDLVVFTMPVYGRVIYVLDGKNLIPPKINVVGFNSGKFTLDAEGALENELWAVYDRPIQLLMEWAVYE